MKKTMKDRKVIIGVIILVALLIGAYFLFSRDGLGFDYGDNGLWVADAWNEYAFNEDTGEYGGYGACYPRDGQTGIVQCCLNNEKEQIDCRDSTKFLSLSPFAVYRGTPGVRFVSHTLVIQNTGEVDINEASLSSFTWTASPTTSVIFLNDMWGGVIGNPKSILSGSQEIWTTGIVDLQENCPTTITTYTITATASATVIIGGIPDTAEQTITRSFDCRRESVSFDFDITF